MDTRATPVQPFRPVAGPAVRWPDSFGTRYTVTVDTEEEFDWTAPLSRDATAVTAIRAVPAAHRRFRDAGVALSWLVDHPVVADRAAVATLAETLTDGRSAIGAQLHPWVTPPFDEAVTPFNSFVGNLPLALEAAKLEVLTDRIATTFGRRPILYRAGRYGIGPHTAGLLAERGYRFDSSVRARYDYASEGGPDFSDSGNAAYRAGPDLIELPLTTALTGRIRSPGLFRRLGGIPRARGAAARLGLVQRVALTPEQMPLTDALEAIRVVHGEGLRLLVFSFHSPSLEPGHTPYVRDASDLATFWRWWDGVLTELARLDIANASLGEIDTALA